MLKPRLGQGRHQGGGVFTNGGVTPFFCSDCGNEVKPKGKRRTVPEKCPRCLRKPTVNNLRKKK